MKKTRLIKIVLKRTGALKFLTTIIYENYKLYNKFY